MAIKEIITLEGVEQVKGQLKDLGSTGEKELKKFSDIGKTGDTANPFNKLVEGAKQAGLGLQEGSQKVGELREAIHVVNPILEEAGVHLGNLGAFARLAGGGIAGLAIAGIGAAIVALNNLGTSAARTKAALDGLFSNQGQGTQALGELGKASANLNTSVSALQPAFQAATIALDRFRQTQSPVKWIGDVPEAVGGIKQVAAATNSLIDILRISGGTEADAEKSAAAFFKTMQEGGVLTAATLKALDNPAAVRALAEAMGRGQISAEQFIAEVALAPIQVDKLIRELAKFAPEAQKAFELKGVKDFQENASTELRKIPENFAIGLAEMPGTFILEANKVVEASKGKGEEIGQNLAKPPDLAPWTATFQQTFDTLVAQAAVAWLRVQEALGKPITLNWDVSNPFLSQQPTGLATGGIVRGAGSTTSDSILALLSNREFVVNARAVSHYGPEFFAALNAMRLPRDFLSRFSMGGLARSLGGNRFASGGQVRSGSPVVLKIDRQSFNMSAGDDTITQLKRFAVTAQLSSSGRKPRWVR